MIMNFYIEVKDYQDIVRLESLFKLNNFPFYNATDVDPLCEDISLEEIESILEDK